MQAAQITNTRQFLGSSIAKAKTNGSRTSMKVAKSWLPGSETPAYLDSAVASYGFGELRTSYNCFPHEQIHIFYDFNLWEIIFSSQHLTPRAALVQTKNHSYLNDPHPLLPASAI